MKVDPATALYEAAYALRSALLVGQPCAFTQAMSEFCIVDPSDTEAPPIGALLVEISGLSRRSWHPMAPTQAVGTLERCDGDTWTLVHLDGIERTRWTNASFVRLPSAADMVEIRARANAIHQHRIAPTP